MPLLSETERLLRGSLVVDKSKKQETQKFILFTYDLQNSGFEAKNYRRSSVHKRVKLLPRITLGSPIAPDPPVVLGGGVPILGLTASTRIDRETKKRSDEYHLLKVQPLPAPERHEYQPHPSDAPPARHIKPAWAKRFSARHSERVYHVYISYVWEQCGLLERLLYCLDSLALPCVAHFLPQQRRHALPSVHNTERAVNPCHISLLLADSLEDPEGGREGNPKLEELRQWRGRMEELEATLTLSRGRTVLYVHSSSTELQRSAQQDNHCILEPGPLQNSIATLGHPLLHPE